MTATEGTFPGPRRTVAVSVSVEVLSVEHGVWCDACMLSTAVTVHYATNIGGRTDLRSKTVCQECS